MIYLSTKIIQAYPDILSFEYSYLIILKFSVRNYSFGYSWQNVPVVLAGIKYYIESLKQTVLNY